MAITNIIKGESDGGLMIRINNVSGSSVGNVIIKDSAQGTVYEHDFGDITTSVAIKIPATDMTREMAWLDVFVDSNAENGEFSFDLSNPDNKANYSSAMGGGVWVYLDCPITW